MRLHIIVDFMHIYYKYFFQLKEGKLKHLSSIIDGVEYDTSLVYYSIRDIEGIRKSLEKLGHEVTISICFDTKSKRKETDENYKSDRPNNLGESDFDNLVAIQDLLETVGYNTYKVEGYEADDIVNYLIRKYSNNYDYNIIYTNDKDLLINIKDNVGVMRFKQYKGYTQVDINNYETYLEQEFKVFIPYNMLGLYLASVGDSADKIKGIHKFGPKAFSKLLTKVMSTSKVDMKTCGDYTELKKIIEECSEHLKTEQFEQLNNSFDLVCNIELNEDIKEPCKKDNYQSRSEAYGVYSFNSLVQ